jgi:hypothetical protein
VNEPHGDKLIQGGNGGLRPEIGDRTHA